MYEYLNVCLAMGRHVVHMYVFMSIFTYVYYEYVCMRTYVYVCLFMYVCTHVYVCVFMVAYLSMY